jgi:putative phage-type endonuclease
LSTALQAREEFVTERRSYLGASDIGAILGVDQYRTPLDVYNEKMGLVLPFEGNRHTERGNRLESMAADLYVELTGRKLRRKNQALVHADYSYLVGHVDRVAVGDKRIVEIKCPSVASYRKVQREGFPDSWIAQLQWYLYLSGYPLGEWVLFCADQFDLLNFEVTADPELHQAMLTKAVEFWEEHIVARIPPSAVDADKPGIEFQKVGGVVVHRDDPQFAEAAELLRDAYLLKGESDELMRLAKTRMKEVVEGEFGKYQGAGVRLSYYQSAGHKSFDKKRLAAEHPEIDLSRYENQGAPFEVFKPFFLGEQ